MSTSDCLEMELEERVLDEARRGSARLPRDLGSHVKECASCRVAFERIRRIGKTWRELEPSAREVMAARARFVARSERRRPVRTMGVVVAFAVLLVGALAFAGVRLAGATRVGAKSGKVTTGADRPSSDLAQAPLPRTSSSSSTPLPIPSTPSAPAPIEVATSAPPAPSAPRVVPTPITPSPWVAAAAAMRTGDYATAELAFNELARSHDARTRDEARLARAQLWIATQRAARARPELESLASIGASPLVRARAADALHAMQASPVSP